MLPTTSGDLISRNHGWRLGLIGLLLVISVSCAPAAADWRTTAELAPTRAAWLRVASGFEEVMVQGPQVLEQLETWDAAMAAYRAFWDVQERFLADLDALPEADGTITRAEFDQLRAAYNKAHRAFAAAVIINTPNGGVSQELVDLGDLDDLGRTQTTRELRMTWRSGIDEAARLLAAMLAKRGIEQREVASYATAMAK
jgi:hypothetical protein